MEIIDNNASQLLTITEQKAEKLKNKSSQKKKSHKAKQKKHKMPEKLENNGSKTLLTETEDKGKKLKEKSQPKKEGLKKLKTEFYEKEIEKLQIELVKQQEWIKEKGLRVVIIFEGRDAAGKGGIIKRITEFLNPRGCRIVALGTPSDREKTQWYFQRYVAHLPAAGEIVLFDRSWYNRAGVERVMNFCTDEQYQEFLHSCPEFERMLVRAGIILIKYWFSVNDEEQERRFQDRANNPAKHWKLSPMDIKSRDLWVEYSQAKDQMFAHTNIPEAPWFTIDADDKKRARLNCISHILSKIPYEDLTPPPLELPPRRTGDNYIRPPLNEQFFVPQVY